MEQYLFESKLLKSEEPANHFAGSSLFTGITC